MERPKEVKKDYDSWGDAICDWDDYVELKKYSDYLENKVELLTIELKKQ